MPQPQYRTSVKSAGLDDRSVTLPGNVGDLLLAFFVDDVVTAAIAPPTETIPWTAGHAVVQAVGHTSQWWYRVKDGTEADPSIFTTDSSTGAALHIIALDPNGGTGWVISDEDVTTGGPTDASAEGPTVTVPADAFLILNFTNDSQYDTSSIAPDDVGVAKQVTAQSDGFGLSQVTYASTYAAGSAQHTLTWSGPDEWHAYAVVVTIGSGDSGSVATLPPVRVGTDINKNIFRMLPVGFSFKIIR